ncbi:hypothetical protein Q5P01_013838 [Channa striata]|uniref:Uncharacterized protein n=1 Tax=Channa striata TaxID=64152 RepID=A0AA88MK10_CHASR|nr:hypothetical protein Q5P01_013838 [Channa striata]
MASPLTTWVWFCLVLARLKSAESRFVRGRLAAMDEFYDRNQEPFEAAPLDRTQRIFSAPVWNFLQVPEASDLNQPQYRCSNGALFLRVSLIRYSNLRFEDGVQLFSLPKRCRDSISVYKWWLMIKFAYTGCLPAIQTGDDVGFHSLKLNYYDHLLQRNMTSMAVCENPSGSTQAGSLLVICRTPQVTVKLPRGSVLWKVKELDFFTKRYSVRQRKTPNALFVVISKLRNMDTGFEVVYSDSSGKLCTVLASCFHKLQQQGVRHHVKRALEQQDYFDLWNFYDIPSEAFDPQRIATTQTWTSSVIDSPQSSGSSGTDTIYDYGEGFYQLWGLGEIPEKPYSGIDIIIPAQATTTAPTTTTMMATPATTTTTTVAPTSTTTAPTTTTATTTAAPATTTQQLPLTTAALNHHLDNSGPHPTTTTTTTAPTHQLPYNNNCCPATTTTTTMPRHHHYHDHNSCPDHHDSYNNCCPGHHHNNYGDGCPHDDCCPHNHHLDNSGPHPHDYHDNNCPYHDNNCPYHHDYKQLLPRHHHNNHGDNNCPPPP